MDLYAHCYSIDVFKTLCFSTRITSRDVTCTCAISLNDRNTAACLLCIYKTFERELDSEQRTGTHIEINVYARTYAFICAFVRAYV